MFATNAAVVLCLKADGLPGRRLANGGRRVSVKAG